MADFLNVVHVWTKADDYVEAITAADDIKLGIERALIDIDSGEAVEIVQTIPIEEDPTPSASITQLRRARNILIRTRTKDGFEVARQLDMMAHALQQRLSPDDAHTNYDWSTFMAVTSEVLKGENPLDY